MTMHMDNILFAITEMLKTGTMNSWTSHKRLELLDLSGNRKLGNNILPNISGLPSLKYLRLGFTGLTGQIELRGKHTIMMVLILPPPTRSEKAFQI